MLNYMVAKNSGLAELDDAALKALHEIGEEVGFTPARNRGQEVPAWVQQALAFAVKE